MTKLAKVMAGFGVVLAVVSVVSGQFAAFLMGLLQGIAEFLPISSSAHLILLPWLFAWEDPLLHSLTFDVALHVGTLAAIIAYFWTDWMTLLRALPQLFKRQQTPAVMMVWGVVLGTIPAAIVGLLLQDVIETSLRHPIQIAVVLAVMGVVIAVVDIRSRAQRSLAQLTYRDAVWIGIAQSLALIPGVSRSGATMSAGRLLGFDRVAVARFSFLLSMPITLAAVVGKAPDLLAIRGGDVLTTLIGVLTAAVTGVLVIDLMLQWIRQLGFVWFAYYRIVLACVVVAVWFVRG
ncbi:MAG: undecaprenyl-diphosphate phosphatase [Roseiflexaceae bacterium]|nr:undecaprenyl-diphosphate phosphatase [Chloroflexaceae bacterium]